MKTEQREDNNQTTNEIPCTQKTESGQFAPLEDLNARNSEEIKGGLTYELKNVLVSSFQSGASNHNETVSEDNQAEAGAETLEDLPVSDEQSAEVAGGLPAVQACREAASRNHNETVSEDNEAEEPATEPLDDLTVDESTEAEIKGGPFTSVQYPYHV